MKKSELSTNALLAVAGLFDKYESTGTKIDTQEADYKSVAQAVQVAINTPEDIEPLPVIVAPQPAPAPAIDTEAIRKIITDDLHSFKIEVAEAITSGMRELLAEIEASQAAKAAAQAAQ